MTLYINDEKVDPAQIDAEIEKLKPDYQRVFVDQPPADQAKQLHEWSRENIIERVLLRQIALADNRRIPDQLIENAYNALITQHGGQDNFYQHISANNIKHDQIKTDIENQLKIERLINSITGNVPPPTEKSVSKYYEKHPDEFMIPKTIRASHIVKHPDDDTDMDHIYRQMQEIRANIKNKTDFEKMAAERSSCPENAGDLGFFAPGQMVQQFEDVVFAMDPGQISDVFQTQFGYHIAMVTDKKDAIQSPLNNEIREYIIKKLHDQACQRSIEKFIDTAKADAKIEEK